MISPLRQSLTINQAGSKLAINATWVVKLMMSFITDVCVSFPLSLCVCSVSSCLIDLDLVWLRLSNREVSDWRRFWVSVPSGGRRCGGRWAVPALKTWQSMPPVVLTITITVTIYFIHPSGKLKLSFDRGTTKNISIPKVTVNGTRHIRVSTLPLLRLMTPPQFLSTWSAYTD